MENGRNGLPFRPSKAPMDRAFESPDLAIRRWTNHWSLANAAFTASKFGRSFGVAVCSA